MFAARAAARPRAAGTVKRTRRRPTIVRYDTVTTRKHVCRCRSGFVFCGHRREILRYSSTLSTGRSLHPYYLFCILAHVRKIARKPLSDREIECHLQAFCLASLRRTECRHDMRSYWNPASRSKSRPLARLPVLWRGPLPFRKPFAEQKTKSGARTSKHQAKTAHQRWERTEPERRWPFFFTVDQSSMKSMALVLHWIS